MFAACTTTTNNSPSVSTKMCRLTPLIFFPRVVSPGATRAGRFDRLAVDATGARFGFLPDRLPDPAAEGVVDLRPQPVTTPPMEVVADRPLGWKIRRQGRPRAACTQAVSYTHLRAHETRHDLV